MNVRPQRVEEVRKEIAISLGKFRRAGNKRECKELERGTGVKKTGPERLLGEEKKMKREEGGYQ